MSALAAQLILHPTVSQSLKVWSTTLGRDKTYRGIQYFARFLAWYLLSRGYKDQATRWNALKAALASGRKLMRLFKPLEHFQAALRASSPSHASMIPPSEQFGAVLRQLSYAGYLTFDSLVWANSIKFLAFDPERAAKINKISQRFWLAGIVFGIATGVLKTQRLNREAAKLRKASKTEESIGEITEKKTKIRTLAIERGATRYQLVQDLLDVWLPASNLEYVNINDGVAGILGTVTSIMAFRLAWAAAAPGGK